MQGAHHQRFAINMAETMLAKIRRFSVGAGSPPTGTPVVFSHDSSQTVARPSNLELRKAASAKKQDGKPDSAPLGTQLGTRQSGVQPDRSMKGTSLDLDLAQTGIKALSLNSSPRASGGTPLRQKRASSPKIALPRLLEDFVLKECIKLKDHKSNDADAYRDAENLHRFATNEFVFRVPCFTCLFHRVCSGLDNFTDFSDEHDALEVVSTIFESLQTLFSAGHSLAVRSSAFPAAAISLSAATSLVSLYARCVDALKDKDPKKKEHLLGLISRLLTSLQKTSLQLSPETSSSVLALFAYGTRLLEELIN